MRTIPSGDEAMKIGRESNCGGNGRLRAGRTGWFSPIRRCAETRSHPHDLQHVAAGFTLMEVMIAGGILFMCLFAILALVASSLRNARLLQNSKEDPTSSVAAIVTYMYCNTNGAIGPISGDFQGRSYEAEPSPLTNGLYLVDLVLPAQRGSTESRMQFLIYNGKQIQRRP
jgi:hypothetical protein